MSRALPQYPKAQVLSMYWSWDDALSILFGGKATAYPLGYVGPPLTPEPAGELFISSSQTLLLLIN